MLITYNNGYSLAFLYIFGVLYTDSECGFGILYTDSECVWFWCFEQTQNVLLSLSGSNEISCEKYGPTYHSPLDYAPQVPSHSPWHPSSFYLDPLLLSCLHRFIWCPSGQQMPQNGYIHECGLLTSDYTMSFLSWGTMNCLQTLVSACTLATIICLQVVRLSEASRARLPPWQETYRPITQILCR